MSSSKATTVEQYLDELPPDRREAITKVRDVILKNLPEGYVETMRWGMISYEIPLEMFPDTYNGQPAGVAGLAAQKNYNSVYLMNVVGPREEWFKSEYRKTGKKLDMGKSCVRFKKLDDLPLDLVGEAIATSPVKEMIGFYKMARRNH